MDVSRIEAFNPNKINWRNLTAKEILKYQKQGVEVPDIYVQWANNFVQNIEKYDNDEITYEKDQLSIPQDNLQQENIPQIPQTEDEISQENSSEAPQLTAAQSKRKEMDDNGISLRKQALSFTSDSKTTATEAMLTEILMNIIKADSDSEIQELEGVMKELIAQAEARQNELRTNVDNINNSNNNNTDFIKIEQLQKELEQYGKNAQNLSSQSENNLNSFENEIVTGSDILANATDFGAETISVGNELISDTNDMFFLKRLINFIIGKQAVAAGENSISKAQNGENALTGAQSTNVSNINKINSIKNEIRQKTGVAPQKQKEQNSAPKQDPITNKEQESQKDIKSSQNNGTDTSDKMNISLDELVKRKVRKGEYSQQSPYS